MKLRSKGWTTLEYAVLISVIMAAIFAMQVLLRNAISGKWKSSADSIGGGMQYEPGLTTITN